MALQLNYTYAPFNTTYMNAYWRIDSKNGIIGGKDGFHYNLQMFINADHAHAKNSRPIDSFRGSFIPNLSGGTPNIIAQAYNYAKTLSQFAGSVDV